MSARGLDHLVLSVDGLDPARERLSELGFTVAPRGAHPFGTVNACVYLADGTFVEPLAVGDADAVEAAATAGNSFVLGDRHFRAARGGEGLSGAVLASSDAEADHERFARQGIAGGPMVAFSRPFVDGGGEADTASFLLAFAAPPGGADAFFFACERCKVPLIDRSALERHDNGAARIVAVEAQAADPSRFATFLGAMAEASVTREGVALANATVRIAENSAARAPRLTGIVFGVRSLAATRALFKARGIVYEEGEGRLDVPATAGQGASFVFEETP